MSIAMFGILMTLGLNVDRLAIAEGGRLSLISLPIMNLASQIYNKLGILSFSWLVKYFPLRESS